jgi:ribokinase
VSHRFDVCVVGSANLDLVATTERLPLAGETVLGRSYAEHPGGKGLNQAVAAARSGADVVFVAALGDDEAAVRLRGVLAADRIDAGQVVCVPGATGRAIIVVDAEGENQIVVIPGANQHLTLPEALPPCSVLLVQREVPETTVAAALHAANAAGTVTILNPAPAAPLPAAVLGCCDVIVPNEHEVAALGGPSAMLAAGCGAVVITRGGHGVDVHTVGDVIHLDAFEVDVVDTTGAGDAFCGSLAARLAAGDELIAAVRWAGAAGALATTTVGAVPSQPTADRIRALLSGR